MFFFFAVYKIFLLLFFNTGFTFIVQISHSLAYGWMCDQIHFHYTIKQKSLEFCPLFFWKTKIPNSVWSHHIKVFARFRNKITVFIVIVTFFSRHLFIFSIANNRLIILNCLYFFQFFVAIKNALCHTRKNRWVRINI